MALEAILLSRILVFVLFAPPQQFVLSAMQSNPEKAAPNGNLPAGSAILDRFVEVTGGRIAFKRLYNRVRHDRVIHVGMGFEDKATVYTARPNKRYVKIESNAMGNIKNGTDGTVVWYLPEEADPIVEEGEAREVQIAAAAFDRLGNWRANYDKAERVREITIDDIACYEVLLTPKVGAVEMHYYGKETGLLLKVRKTRISSVMPPIVLEVSFSNYRLVDGVRLPYKISQKFDQCGSPREIQFVTERLDHNVNLPSDRFTPPSVVMTAAAIKKIGGVVKGLTGGSNGKPQAPCGSRGKPKKAPCGTVKSQSRTPHNDGT